MFGLGRTIISSKLEPQYRCQIFQFCMPPITVSRLFMQPKNDNLTLDRESVVTETQFNISCYEVDIQFCHSSLEGKGGSTQWDGILVPVSLMKWSHCALILTNPTRLLVPWQWISRTGHIGSDGSKSSVQLKIRIKIFLDKTLWSRQQKFWSHVDWIVWLHQQLG